MTAACLFCRIVAGEIPAALVAETADCLAFRDVTPQAPTHVLVIPREHVASLTAAAVDPGLLGRMLKFASDVAQRLEIAESGYRVVINDGADAGQSVAHLHAHVLGGRPLRWPPG